MSSLVKEVARKRLEKWDESKHPRAPKGSSTGGQFAKKSTGTYYTPSQIANVLSHDELYLLGGWKFHGASNYRLYMTDPKQVALARKSGPTGGMWENYVSALQMGRLLRKLSTTHRVIAPVGTTLYRGMTLHKSLVKQLADNVGGTIDLKVHVCTSANKEIASNFGFSNTRRVMFKFRKVKNGIPIDAIVPHAKKRAVEMYDKNLWEYRIVGQLSHLRPEDEVIVPAGKYKITRVRNRTEWDTDHGMRRIITEFTLIPSKRIGKKGMSFMAMSQAGVHHTGAKKRKEPSLIRALRSEKAGMVMDEFKKRKLRSGSKKGPIVRNKRQAIAIARSVAGLDERKKARKGSRKRLSAILGVNPSDLEALLSLGAATTLLECINQYEKLKKCAQQCEKGVKHRFASYACRFYFTTVECAKKFVQKIDKDDCCEHVDMYESKDYDSGSKKVYYCVSCKPKCEGASADKSLAYSVLEALQPEIDMSHGKMLKRPKGQLHKVKTKKKLKRKQGQAEKVKVVKRISKRGQADKVRPTGSDELSEHMSARRPNGQFMAKNEHPKRSMAEPKSGVQFASAMSGSPSGSPGRKRLAKRLKEMRKLKKETMPGVSGKEYAKQHRKTVRDVNAIMRSKRK